MSNFVLKIDNEENAVIASYSGTDTDIVIPAEAQGFSIVGIDTWAFLDCRNITSVVIPDNIKYIGDSAFQNCINLSSVSMGNGVSHIKTFTFCHCDSLKNMVIPDGVLIIDDYAFSDCKNLTSITIPNSVSCIRWSAFDNCFNLKAIKCHPGSFAERWANDNGFKTEPIMSQLQQLLNQTDSSVTKVHHSNFADERSDHNEI